jgi:methanesulfonate monooxygenase small subunit
MDDKNFSDYLDLCDPDYNYKITAYSPEIRKDMIWLEQDRAGMKNLFDTLPRHNSDHSLFNRHACVYSVEFDEAAKQAKVVSTLQVFRTTLDGGATELFAIGKMYDTVSTSGNDGPKLLDRNIRLDTRLLGMGTHIPF